MGNRAMIDLFRAAIANIWCLIQTLAAFFFEILASLITSWTGGALNATKKNLSAGVGFLTIVAVDTEIFCIVKGTLVVPVGETVRPYFL